MLAGEECFAEDDEESDDWGVICSCGEELKSEGGSAREEKEGVGANCDGVMWVRMRFSPGEALIKLTFRWSKPSFSHTFRCLPLFTFSNFILHRLWSILSPADRNCYADPVKLAVKRPAPTALFMSAILKALGRKRAGLLFWLLLFLFFTDFGGTRYPQVAMCWSEIRSLPNFAHHQYVLFLSMSLPL